MNVLMLVWRYKTVALLIAAGLYLGYYKIQYSRYAAKYKDAIAQAESLERALSISKNRERALYELEAKQRKEDEEINERIRNRTYFNSN
jgi:hypothetical protein